ncbi:ATP binding, partial [Coemansia sp. RSA 2320]
TGVSIALVPSATAGANPLLGAASAVSAMTSVTAMAAVPTATAADSAAAYAQVPGIKDLPVLPRVSLSSTAIGIGGNAGSILQRANTDMRPFATVQDRRAKQPQPHSLAHGGGGSGGGIALRRHKVGGDTGSPQSANKGSAESSLFHLKKPPTDKISSLNASKESATAASTASPQKLGVLARLDEAALEPMSAPLPRIRMLTSSQQRAASSGSPPTVAPLQQLRDAIESSRLGNGRSTGPAEEIERLGLQFQEFFGTDISVSNLADSLTVKTWNVTITGPENQARQVAITNTSSAQTILDRVRRAFDLDNDIDGDQYSLFSMTSEGGGARCLSNEELVRVFSSSENAPTDKLFLRKRHQLSRPPMGSKRSEHLQRAIERLGNIIPSTLTSPPSQQQQQQQQQAAAASRTKSSHGKKKTWIKGAPIASGSFGSVYFGMNSRTGAIMAVKEVELPKPGSASMSRNQRMADALRHELDLLKGLDHRNVVRYLGTDIDERNIYIFLEYVSGGSVSSALASFGMFPESLVRTYTAQIIEGLVYLHDQGIIHRDIKGGNVLIDQDGSVKISDFGISKRVDEVVATSKTDRRASLQGSVFWMAPEVVKDTKYTVKGDVWSLGCLVIEMMTGTHPFPDLDQMQALYSIGQRSRPHIPDDISAAGRDFLEQALQVDLGMRPTAKDLLPHSFVSDTAAPQTP